MVETVEPDVTLYGPLSGLIGTWEGSQGLDVAPEPAGAEENPYYETIVCEGCGTAQNAGEQTLAVVRYHEVVRRKADGEVFHDQVGYWMWDPSTGVVMQSLTIPRGVCVLAGGEAVAEDDRLRLTVAARRGDEAWGIVQSPFMQEKARTVAFAHEVVLFDGDRLLYEETTSLEIYGKTFEHTDRNELVRR